MVLVPYDSDSDENPEELSEDSSAPKGNDSCGEAEKASQDVSIGDIKCEDPEDENDEPPVQEAATSPESSSAIAPSGCVSSSTPGPCSSQAATNPETLSPGPSGCSQHGGIPSPRKQRLGSGPFAPFTLPVRLPAHSTIVAVLTAKRRATMTLQSIRNPDQRQQQTRISDNKGENPEVENDEQIRQEAAISPESSTAIALSSGSVSSSTPGQCSSQAATDSEPLSPGPSGSSQHGVIPPPRKLRLGYASFAPYTLPVRPPAHSTIVMKKAVSTAKRRATMTLQSIRHPDQRQLQTKMIRKLTEIKPLAYELVENHYVLDPVKDKQIFEKPTGYAIKGLLLHYHHLRAVVHPKMAQENSHLRQELKFYRENFVERNLYNSLTPPVTSLLRAQNEAEIVSSRERKRAEELCHKLEEKTVAFAALKNGLEQVSYKKENVDQILAKDKEEFKEKVAQVEAHACKLAKDNAKLLAEVEKLRKAQDEPVKCMKCHTNNDQQSETQLNANRAEEEEDDDDDFVEVPEGNVSGGEEGKEDEEDLGADTIMEAGSFADSKPGGDEGEGDENFQGPEEFEAVGVVAAPEEPVVEQVRQLKTLRNVANPEQWKAYVAMRRDSVPPEMAEACRNRTVRKRRAAEMPERVLPRPKRNVKSIYARR